jgi:protein-S-isoprenylcysteine O-methyltransferase
MAAMLAAPLLNRLRLGCLPSKVATAPTWSGVVAMLAGLTIRVWAMRVLGASYTRTLRTTTEQHLVTVGPYRLIRHPGYLGTLLVWIGGGMATANWIVAMAIALGLGRAYRSRLQAEEEMLAATFGDAYPGYASRTWRLVPFIY